MDSTNVFRLLHTFISLFSVLILAVVLVSIYFFYFGGLAHQNKGKLAKMTDYVYGPHFRKNLFLLYQIQYSQVRRRKCSESEL
jgi:hypothetical protein